MFNYNLINVLTLYQFFLIITFKTKKIDKNNN